MSPVETSAHHAESPRLQHTAQFSTGEPVCAPQHRNDVLAFSRWDASVCTDSTNGQWILILHGVHRPGVSEKAKPRLLGSVNPGHTFFNVSQGKFGLFSLRVSPACCCVHWALMFQRLWEKLKESAQMRQRCCLFIRPAAPLIRQVNCFFFLFVAFTFRCQQRDWTALYKTTSHVNNSLKIVPASVTLALENIWLSIVIYFQN